jgi:hypothetical protein
VTLNDVIWVLCGCRMVPRNRARFNSLRAARASS